jgi:hydroxymethylbilane synthase
MIARPPRSLLRIATRGSQLALWQADYVTALLRARGVACERLVLKTTADRIQDRPLQEIGGKGLFVKELEEALLRGEADLAVHSLKDMTARLDPRFALPSILKRHEPADLLIFRSAVAAQLGVRPGPLPVFGVKEIAALPPLKVGTGSLRRQAVLRKAAPQLTSVGIRGNVDTRLRKLEAGEWDAIILAEASIERLAISGLASVRLDPEWFIPCAAQGALAIETRADDQALVAWLGELSDPATQSAVTVERAVLAGLGGDCNMPFGCHVRLDGSTWRARAAVYDQAGNTATATCTMPAAGFSTSALTREVAAQLRAAGAGAILAALGLEVPEGYA